MPTQTGSIDFKSTKGFQSYASGQYATLTQVKGQFATCSTAAGTQAKAATIVPSDTGWELYTGATITVRFTADNTHATPTLDVNSTGAKSIRDHTGAALTEEAYKWKAGDALAFTYDGIYWRMQDTLAQRVTTNKTAIEQNASDILLRATKTEASQMAQPNLAPIGSADFSDLYNASTNPDGYWRSTPSSWFTQLEDGWVHCYRDNTSGTAAANTTSWRPSPSPSVEAGKVYTILTEIRNNHSSGSTLTDMYLHQIANNQFWGDISGATIDDDHVTTTTSISLKSCGETYVRYSYRIADTEHLTTAPVELFRYNFRLPAGGKFDFDFRQSVYEGIYDGPYKPYVGSQLYASQAELKVTADGITSTVSSIASAKYVDSTTASWPLASLKIYAAEGHSENWNVVSTNGLRVGDTVYVKGTDGTRACTVYIKTTVTAINSTTSFTGTSHGYEDVLPVESIKSTINQSSDSVKIQARHVEIDGEAIFSSIKDDVANQTALEHSSSGTSIAMDDAATASLKALTIYGKSVQDGTPTPSSQVEIRSVGAVNLLRPEDSTPYGGAATGGGFTVVYEGDGWFHVSGAKTSSGSAFVSLWKNSAGKNDYTAPLNDIVPLDACPSLFIETEGQPFVEGDAYNTSTHIVAYGDSSNVSLRAGGYLQNTFHRVSSVNYISVVRYYVGASVAVGATVDGRFRVALAYAGNDVAWVPPDSIGVEVIGKNLVSMQNMLTKTTEGITWRGSNDGGISATGTASSTSYGTIAPTKENWLFGTPRCPLLNPGTYTVSGDNGIYFDVETYPLDMSAGTQIHSYQQTDYTFTIEEPLYVFVGVRVPSGTVTNTTYHIQLELGSEATEYEPYRGSVTPIPLNGHELRSLPDGTCDELTVDADGRVTMVQRVGSIDFDGSSDETWSVENSGARAVSNGVTNLKFQSSNSKTFNALSNRFVGITPNNTWAGTMAGTSGNISTRRLYFSDGTKAMTADAWRAWLTSNSVTVLFEYETPQTIDLGTIDMPQVKDGDTVEVIAAVTPSIDVTWFSSAGQSVADIQSNVTVIDGARIRTGSIVAEKLESGTITSDQIAAGAISADRLDANALTLGNIEGLEERLDAIDSGLSSISTETQWVHYDPDKGTVFGENGSANNLLVTGDGIDFNTDEGRAAWATGGVFHANEMEAETVEVQTIVMGNWALVQSGTSFYIDYIG